MDGAYKTAEVTPTGAQRSATTNSYNRSGLYRRFQRESLLLRRQVYDRASFDEKVDIEDVVKFNPDTGARYVAGASRAGRGRHL